MTETATGFNEIGLKKEILDALEGLGYTEPTPIQSQCIPPLLEGKSVLGQARTGTGKTAAFALPALNGLELNNNFVQILVLTPTRELGIQVADSFSSYGKNLPGLRVAALYGGQDIRLQLRSLKNNPQVIVATPGRLMDHMKRGSIQLNQLRTLILDEADEMLRMGFIDDVEYILEHTPEDRQTVLFSATMPDSILRVARRHQENPVEIRIREKQEAPATVDQYYRIVRQEDRMAALLRFLDGEDYDGAIVFVSTRARTATIAEYLNQHGHSCSALNGDLSQNEREKIVNNLKNGKVDVVIATDVAARGLDVSRITHVFNFDPPSDVESYVHRIGRTGRAGKKGKAILLLTRRESWWVKSIENTMKTKVQSIELPDHEAITNLRIQQFTRKLAISGEDETLETLEKMLESISSQEGVSPLKLAASMAFLARRELPLIAGHLPDVKIEKQSIQAGSDRGAGSHGKRRYRHNGGGDGNKRDRRRDYNGSSKRSGNTGYHRSGTRSHVG